MNRIKYALLLILGLPTLLWLLADTLVPQPFGYFPFRTAFVQLSGIVAIAAMSVALLLALRPGTVERPLGGLDKMYRLHKWLGIGALVLAVLHWWWAQGTKWLVGWGLLTRPARGPRPDASELAAVEAWFNSQRGLAESVGEWAFYAAAVLIVLALVKRFPYHLFVRTHLWIALVYLALVFHAAVLTTFAYWARPVGWLLGLLLAVGTMAALWALFGRIGAGRRVTGQIEQLQYYPELDVLESRIVLQAGWAGHAAGQFAFVTSDRREGAHPYTIASAWDEDDRRITFITKALGDHTRRLRDSLQIGMTVGVEGPYGCFNFEDASARQIWIGAGIGITPFVARMKQLAREPQSVNIDLFHPTTVYEQAAIDKLVADARDAHVRLHLLLDARDGLLDGERIRVAVPGWAEASIWFCGPPAFGQALRADFLAHGLAAGRFHQELFEMR